MGLSISCLAQSGNAWVDADVAEVLVHDNGESDYAGRVHVKMVDGMSWQPDCIGDSTYYNKSFVIDLSRAPGQYQYSLLLAAKLAGKKITVQVNQRCISGIALVRNVSLVE